MSIIWPNITKSLQCIIFQISSYTYLTDDAFNKNNPPWEDSKGTVLWNIKETLILENQTSFIYQTIL